MLQPPLTTPSLVIAGPGEVVPQLVFPAAWLPKSTCLWPGIDAIKEQASETFLAASSLTSLDDERGGLQSSETSGRSTADESGAVKSESPLLSPASSPRSTASRPTKSATLLSPSASPRQVHSAVTDSEWSNDSTAVNRGPKERRTRLSPRPQVPPPPPAALHQAAADRMRHTERAAAAPKPRPPLQFRAADRTPAPRRAPAVVAAPPPAPPRRRMVKRDANAPVPGTMGLARRKRIEAAAAREERVRVRLRRLQSEFESRVYYHYEVPTVSQLLRAKIPELFAPPCLSTTPHYMYREEG